MHFLAQLRIQVRPALQDLSHQFRPALKNGYRRARFYPGQGLGAVAKPRYLNVSLDQVVDRRTAFTRQAVKPDKTNWMTCSR